MNKPKITRYPLHGWLNIDKPYGMGSTEAVTAVKRLLNPEKIGHGGTLDPLATGILPMALGEATKTVPYTMDAEKIYRFTLSFGSQTTTDDREGEALYTSGNRPTEAELRAVLPDFLGVVVQRPPAFSAIKIGGERAYDLARAGQEVVPELREVWIKSIDIIDYNGEEAVLEVLCGKGTYIRALARDIALKLNSFGHVGALRRLAVGPFTEKNAISLESLEKLLHIHGQVSSAQATELGILAPLEHVLDDIPAVEVDKEAAEKLRLGQAVFIFSEDSLTSPGSTEEVVQEGFCKMRCNGRVVALGNREGRLLKPSRVFQSGFDS